VQKIRAAAQGRSNPDFVIMARTDAAAPLGIDEAIRRANLYSEAGADLLFADAVLSEADIARLCQGVSGPVLVNMGFGVRTRTTTPLLTPARLQELGVAVVIYPRMLTAAAVMGMRNAMRALLEGAESGQAVDRPDLAISFEELNSLMGFDQIQELEGRYLTPEELARKYKTRK
jgi:2-methylisocitrate lyase-like PEP mutase family enzyme